MRKLLSVIGFKLADALAPFCLLAGIFLHIYTVVYAYHVAGFWAAGGTLVFPAIAELVWTALSWIDTGQFINGYSDYVVGYAVLSLVWLVTLFGSSFIAPPDIKTHSEA